MEKVVIEKDLFVTQNIVGNTREEGQRIHDFLISRAKKLAGKYIDFDKTPITFVLADKSEPNAFFIASQSEQDIPSRDRERDVVYTRNPIDTHIICVTSGLIDMVDNLDQLDHVLGHELTHMILNGYGTKKNSKGEEAIADLHAVDLVYDAGGDPKQALVLIDKINAYAVKKKKESEERERQQHYREREDSGIDWSEVLDVHVAHRNRKSGLEASLTRISHLIDDREPTELDKSTFDVAYIDPVDVFLGTQGYETQNTLGKLQILIDALEHLSEDTNPENYLHIPLDLSQDEKTDQRQYQRNRRRFDIEERSRYSKEDKVFNGKIIDKKYQQKIASLAEGVVNSENDNRFDKEGRQRDDFEELDATDLTIYLQNKAYKHIKANGYPKPSDLNYLDATGIMYSYFYMLISGKVPHDRMLEDEDKPASSKIDLVADINRIKDELRGSKTPNDLILVFANLMSSYGTLVEIRSTSYGHYGRGSKLDNLTLYHDHSSFQNDRTNEIKTIYDRSKIKGGDSVPWNNLLDVVQSDENAKACLVGALKQDAIIDYRISHGLPYVQIGGNSSCYKIDGNGCLSAEKVPDYEIEFALNKEAVLEVYAYVRDYFDNEDSFINDTCNAALNIEDKHFREADTTSQKFNKKSLAHRRFYNLISAFNSLPDDDVKERRWRHSDVFSLISDKYQTQNPMPGTNEEGHQKTSSAWSALFEFDNPIFQEHFGDDFKEHLLTKKDGYQARMFETAFSVAKHLPIMWLEAKEKTQALQDKSDSMRDRIRKLPEGKRKRHLSKKREKLWRELEFYGDKTNELETVTFNYFFSIFEKGGHWYNLGRLLPEQRVQMAEHVVKDENGIFRQIFNNGRYEAFCDYLNILVEQTEQVIEGDYSLTDLMQIVANNSNYKRLKTRQQLESSLTADKDRDSESTRYTAFLRAFDLVQYLEASSEFDVRKLSKIISKIDMHHPDNYSRRTDGAMERFEIYKKFITQKGFMNSITRAINLPSNYTGYNASENIETVNSLVKLKNQISPFIQPPKKERAYRSDFYDDMDKSWKQKLAERVKKGVIRLKDVFKNMVGLQQIKPSLSDEKVTEIHNKKFLNLIEKNIRGLLRKAIHQTLKMDNPLQKITALYELYKSEDESFFSSEDKKKADYLYGLSRKENVLEGISKLAQDKSFWPDDALEHVKAFILAKEVFIDDIEFENTLLHDIFDKVEALPAGKKKNECLYALLDKKLRASYPETRERLFNIYTQDITRKLGLDDGSEKYQTRLALYIEAIEGGARKEWDVGEKHGGRGDILSNKMSSADKYILLRKISDSVLSQEKTSLMMKQSCQVSLNADDLASSYLYGVGIDGLTSEMDRDSNSANRFIQFLNSKGEMSDCEDISAFVEETMKERLKKRDDKRYLNSLLESTQPVNCKVLYENFWSAPLEARAVIVARMLKSAVVDNDHKGEINENHSWERVFDVVMNNIISPDDTSTEARYAQDIMHSYIKSRSDYERELILSAMMVANRNIGEDAGNVGKALKLFLENMGPAEIKLGQAIASHPNTPDSIRIELQGLKNSADMPARWTVYDWIKNENIPEAYWKDRYLGAILGSASYYTTIAIGDDDVLRMLRPEAREKANKGFKVIGDTIDDLKEKDASSELDYKELTSSVQQMVTQAARMSHIETNHDIGEQQKRSAQEIYNSVTLTSGSETFKLEVMDWTARGKNWMLIKRAHGQTFNDLPQSTPEQIAYKKHVAKSYITFEIGTILSGQKFDHDRHGAQFCIDENTNRIGVFDTGAMALNYPTVEEQKLLGNVVYDAMKSAMLGEQAFTAFSSSITDKIDYMHEQGIDTQYLVEVKKGLLALGDFFKILDNADILEVMPSLGNLDDIAKPIREGIFECMSVTEKAQLELLSASSAFSKNIGITVTRDGNASVISDVINIDVAPTVNGKAEWLSDTLMDSGHARQLKSNSPVKLCA